MTARKRQLYQAMASALAVASLVGCGGAPDIAPSPSSSSTTARPPATTTARMPVANTDSTVCGDFDRLGRAFWESTLVQIADSPSPTPEISVQPAVLAGELAALTTIGAQPGEIDGAETIGMASPNVRTKIFTVVRDADRFAQALVSASVTGVLVGSDLSGMSMSFTEAMRACTEVGFTPTFALDTLATRAGGG